MANTTIPAASTTTGNYKLAVKKFAAEMFEYSLAHNPFTPYMNTGADAIIQIKKDLMKSKGEKIQFDIINPLSGSGQGTGLYEGNEEAMTMGSMEVIIDQNGNSVCIDGEMDEQRTIHDLRSAAKDQLGIWSGQMDAAYISASLSGLATMGCQAYISGALAVNYTGVAINIVNKTAPVKSATAPRWYAGGQTTAGVLSARVASDAAITNTSGTHLFGTRVISAVKALAQKQFDASGNHIGAVRPYTTKDGLSYYVMFISREQETQLKLEAAWNTAQQTANLRGNENPIFTGACGIWDGVIIRPIDQIHSRKGDATGTAVTTYFEAGDPCANGVTVHRALFCGSQAACMAYGKMPTWNEKLFDYGNKFGVNTRMIAGCKKVVFTGDNFASDDARNCIIVDTAVAAA